MKPKIKSTGKAVNVSIEEIVDLFNNRLFELFSYLFSDIFKVRTCVLAKQVAMPYLYRN